MVILYMLCNNIYILIFWRCFYKNIYLFNILNNREFNGRTLRVDFAENEKASMQQLQAIQSNLAKGLPVTATIPSTTNTMNVPQNLSSSRPPTNLPTIPNNSNAPSIPETINSMLDGLNNIQLYDIVSKMKLFIQSNPDQARQLLLSHPPLAYALLQAQALLGMIQIHTVQKILSKNPSAMNIGGTTGISSPIGINSMPTLGVPTVIANPAPTPTPPLIPTMTPTYGGSLFSPGIMPFQTSTPITSLSLTEEQQKQLLQVMSLTQEQIDQLSPEQRQQVQQLRQTFQQNFRF
jgi:cleavage stimulation factor subunit 2